MKSKLKELDRKGQLYKILSANTNVNLGSDTGSLHSFSSSNSLSERGPCPLHLLGLGASDLGLVSEEKEELEERLLGQSRTDVAETTL